MAHRTGLLGIIRNILGLDHRVDESTPCTTYGRIEGSKTHLGFASAKEAENPPANRRKREYHQGRRITIDAYCDVYGEVQYTDELRLGEKASLSKQPQKVEELPF